ncbi:XRE family transcriptional regulator [Lentzea sp. BCCO 10_0061]|uniref:XRE family transcriptional regulator n=1 Tax=Lentzea sokolovensis TaxID=3095429 RepID=A0ABU4V422_9PSEU|nr:XRE family transcriptional regulator [Lentzea sp. BCCO 10_0061]MDX8146087.1 XRE family transcriptional regulator [Lentzea sp. BCCO 10_0061]
MPRPERPLELDGTALVEFAVDLRRLRQDIGGPSYRELGKRGGYSATTLAEAAGGRRFPSLEVTLAYVRACDGDVELWEQRWHSLAAELNATVVAEPEDYDQAPYVGLSVYRAEDASRFFGRERLVDDLLALVQRQKFVAVFGPSGSGKSSLIRAGLLPRLPAHVLRTPGDHPMRLVPGFPSDQETVVVVDQFEEVFTLCQDADERTRFIAELLGRRAVIGVRSDFYTHCCMIPELAGALQDSQFTVGPMTAEELRRAITLPAVKANCTVESNLAATLIAHAHGQAGVLPLLSHALLETWRRRSGNRLTLTGFQAVGGIDGALAKTAEAVYGSLDARQQGRARDLFRRLAVLGENTEDTKRRISPAELDDDQDTAVVLDRCTAARLVVRDTDSIEITHEALIRTWPRFREWLSSDRDGQRVHRELTHATDVWEQLDRDRSALYRGARLAIAREWATRSQALTVRERAFVEASTDAEAEEHVLARRRAKRLGYLVGVLAALLVVSAVTTFYAVRTRNDITSQRNSAIAQNLASEAVVEHRANPSLGLQLGLAAHNLAATRKTRDAVLSTLATVVTAHDEEVYTATFSSDGTLATAGRDHSIHLWNVSDRRKPVRLGTLTGHTGAVRALSYRADGKVLASSGDDGTVRLWAEQKEIAALTGMGSVRAATFSPDGQTLVAGSGTGEVRTWNVSDPRNPVLTATVRGHTDAVRTVAFSLDGKTLATGSDDHSVRLWQDGAEIMSLSGNRIDVYDLAFSPDGRTLAVGSGNDKPVRLWNVTDPRKPAELPSLTGHEDVVGSVAFSPDGRTLASGSDDRTVRLWNVTDPGHVTEIATLSGAAIAVADIAFSPDGRTLVWTMFDPTMRLLNADLGAAVAEACGSAGARLTEDEWRRHVPDVPYTPPC